MIWLVFHVTIPLRSLRVLRRVRRVKLKRFCLIFSRHGRYDSAAVAACPSPRALREIPTASLAA